LEQYNKDSAKDYKNVQVRSTLDSSEAAKIFQNSNVYRKVDISFSWQPDDPAPILSILLSYMPSPCI